LRRPVSLDSDQFGAFPQGMRDRGYVEGKNLVIEWRFADGNSERLPGLALLLEDVTPKQLEMLRIMVPNLSRVAVLANPANVSYAVIQKNVQVAARAAGVDVISMQARSGEPRSMSTRSSRAPGRETFRWSSRPCSSW